jgi:acetyltransferase
VRDAAEAILAQARRLRPDARIDGVVLQQMVRRPRAHELILGLSEDRVFGPVVLFGAGGTSVEVVADKALALPPLDLALARGMIERTRVARLLHGYRDRPAADIDRIAETLVRLALLSADMPEIREIDINPLLADESGVIALDARIVVAPAEAVAPGGNPRFAIRPYPTVWDRPARVQGGEIRIRPIRPEDEALYPEFLAKVTPEDMRLRFFAAVARMGHDEIARLTQIDYARAMAFVALDPTDGSLLGVSRLGADPDRVRAEFALLVRSDAKRRGIGRALMMRLIEYARSEGIGELFGDVLDANWPMRGLCQALGFTEAEHPSDPAVERVRLPLAEMAKAGLDQALAAGSPQ